MALIYVDFVGLNTFVYEPVGADIGAMVSPGTDTDNPLGRDKYEFVNNYATRAYFRDTDNEFGLNQIGVLDESGSLRPIDRYANPLFQTATGVSISNPNRFNALMARRNGPYGHPSWRQIRAGQNPLIRRQRKINSITIVEQGKEVEIIRSAGSSERIMSKYGSLRKFSEPAVTSRYKPLIINAGNKFLDNGTEVIRRFSVKSSLGNQTEFFANQELNALLSLQEGVGSANYDVLKNYYLDGAIANETSPFDLFEFLRYSETIFPKEVNAYKERTRVRTQFLFPWRDDRDNRKETSQTTFTVPVGVQSMWNLDADNDWTTKTISDIAFIRVGGPLTDSPSDTNNWGILQNQYSQVLSPTAATTLSAFPVLINAYFTASCYYSRRHCLTSSTSVVNPAFPGGIPETGSLTSISSSHVFEGTAQWEAGPQAGYYSGSTWILEPKSPFYDSYGKYAIDTRTKGKDYALIPEFRISEKVQDYEENLDWKSAINQDFLKITGSMVNGPSVDGSNYTSQDRNFYETYSNSDFMKHFKVIKNDHDDFADPSSITLTCRGIKKFLPYDGFYPSQRTVQISQQFYNSYKNNIFTTSSAGAGTGADDSGGNFALQTIFNPLFAPGIMFNTIKSGIAVDYPLYTTQGFTTATYEDEIYQDMLNIDVSNDVYNTRIPFEAIISPGSYVANTNFITNEVHPSASFTNSTKIMSAMWDGGGNDLYVKMANNFFAEVPNFFLQDSRLTSLKSLNQGHGDFGNQGGGNVLTPEQRLYGMRVKLYRTTNSSKSPSGSFTLPQDLPGTTTENFTMYSRPSAFGPPVTMDQDSTPSVLKETLLPYGSKKGVNLPFTPPYYHGNSWVDLYFRPSGTTKVSLEEILSNVTSSNCRCFLSHSSVDTSTLSLRINKAAMQLDASINLYGTAQDEPESGGYVSSKDQNETSWVIQTKFETPMLNFNHVSVADGTLTLPGYASESVPRGMWHQYGRLPKADEGVFMQVTDIPTGWISDPAVLSYISASTDGGVTSDTAFIAQGQVKSLADLCGFSKEPVRIGGVAETKLVKEAVVAIPFIERAGSKKFFNIPREDFDAAMEAVPLEPNRAGQSVREMAKKMQPYVFPPQMDFRNNKDLDPFAMYIFEFEHVLSQKDLADIWQNLPPEVGTSMEEVEASVSHDLFVEEMLGRGAIEEDDGRVYHGKHRSRLRNNMRWMVFKVKQRAKTNYYDNVLGNSLVKQQNASKLRGLTYNWPYDFFSLVELIKIDAEIDFADVTLNDSEGIDVAPKVSQTPVSGLTDGGARIANAAIASGPTAAPAAASPAGGGMSAGSGGPGSISSGGDSSGNSFGVAQTDPAPTGPRSY